MAKSYPLEAARTLRDAELDEARVALARGAEEVDLARAAEEAAVRSLEEHRAQTITVEQRENERDRRGRTAEEMMRGRSYLSRRMTEESGLARAVERAASQHARAREQLELARAALADARAAREAVERHHDKWVAEERRRADARAEAEQDDLTASRHRGGQE